MGTESSQPNLAYWQTYYSGSALPEAPSDFAVHALPHMASYTDVIELGCGNGRDSMFFLEQGKRIRSVDACSAAIEACNSKASARGFGPDRAAFAVGEAGSAATWQDLSAGLPGPVAIYARFLLHAIDEATEVALLDHACTLIERQGGILLAEFRTPADTLLAKQAPAHYRRYVDPEHFCARLAERGMAVIYRREGQGMACMGIEDAHVARFVAGPAVSYDERGPSPALEFLQREEKRLAATFFEWCAAQELTAFLVCGSALGAVRHGDMIPWDDDIDIGMLRADFEHLFERFALNPIHGSYLQSHRCEDRYPYPFAKLRLDGTAVVEPAFTAPKSHSGLFIDIFPFDALPRSAILRRCQHAALGVLNLFIMPPSPDSLAATRSRLLRAARRIMGRMHPIPFLRFLIKRRAWWTELSWAKKSGIVDSFGMYGIRYGPNTPIAADLLTPPVRARFGEIDAWLPRATEQYLTSLFGDFRTLPPEAQRRPGHVTTVDFGRLTEDRRDADTPAEGRLAAEEARR